MQNYYPPLLEGMYYHIYNRGNNKGNIFYTPKNYKYFLIKYKEYISTYLETYAYCLFPNHFHFLVRVKERNPDSIALSAGIGNRISEQFRRFFIGYSQAINKQEKRTGSLFEKKFKRICITSNNHLVYLIYYIHANPQNHGLISDFSKYPYSSYSGMLGDQPTRLQRKEVMNWFGSKSEYVDFHKDIRDLKDIQYIMIEED